MRSHAPSSATSDLPSPVSLFVKDLAPNGSPPWREDDKDGHYKFELGENLTSRYKIHSKMGEGTFGQVLECWDNERKEMVAVKIVRGMRKYRKAAMIEIEVLQQLGRHDIGSNRVHQGSRRKLFPTRELQSQPLLSRHTEKYTRRSRLDWPEGATSRDSIRAVLKLPRLQNLVMQHVDHSAGDLIHLLQGLRYDPSEGYQLTVRSSILSSPRIISGDLEKMD